MNTELKALMSSLSINKQLKLPHLKRCVIDEYRSRWYFSKKKFG